MRSMKWCARILLPTADEPLCHGHAYRKTCFRTLLIWSVIAPAVVH